jgi:hypothetical protein
MSSKSRGHKCISFHMLKVTTSMHGFVTEVALECSICDFKVEANPTDKKVDYDGKNCFLKYGINYKAVLLMQHLGIGTQGLGLIMSFLGIAAGTGNDQKWKDIQDCVGCAQEKLCDRVIEENIAEEIQLTKEDAAKKYAVWEATEGLSADAQTKVKKKDELLRMCDNKYSNVQMIPVATLGGRPW